MRVDVVDVAFNRRHGLLHAAHGALARRRYHIVAIRRRAETDEFGVNLGAAGFRVFEFLDHDHARA